MFDIINKLKKCLTSLYDPNPLYTENLNDRIVKEVAKDAGVSENELYSGVKYRNLPTLVKRIGRGIYRTLGKVLGMYDPDRDTVTIDKTLREYAKHSWNGLRNLITATAHEFYHKAQNIKGRLKEYTNFSDYLKNYDDNVNEREADRVAEKVADELIKEYKSKGTYPQFNVYY